MPIRPLLFLTAVALLAPSGCGPAKLDVTKTYELDPAGENVKCLYLDPQPRPQRLTVEYKSDAPVEVAIFKREDAQNLDSLPASKALATEKAKSSGNLSVDLGPDQGTAVVVSALSKKTAVTLQITNRK